MFTVPLSGIKGGQNGVTGLQGTYPKLFKLSRNSDQLSNSGEMRELRKAFTLNNPGPAMGGKKTPHTL